MYKGRLVTFFRLLTFYYRLIPFNSSRMYSSLAIVTLSLAVLVAAQDRVVSPLVEGCGPSNNASNGLECSMREPLCSRHALPFLPPWFLQHDRLSLRGDICPQRHFLRPPQLVGLFRL